MKFFQPLNLKPTKKWQNISFFHSIRPFWPKTCNKNHLITTLFNPSDLTNPKLCQPCQPCQCRCNFPTCFVVQCLNSYLTSSTQFCIPKQSEWKESPSIYSNYFTSSTKKWLDWDDRSKMKKKKLWDSYRRSRWANNFPLNLTHNRKSRHTFLVTFCASFFFFLSLSSCGKMNFKGSKWILPLF